MIYKEPLIKSFYLCIIDSIKKDSKLPDKKQLNISKQSLNYYVKTLKVDGIIRKIGYGVWEVDQDVLDRLKFIKKTKQVKIKPLARGGMANKEIFTSLTKNIRTHGFIVSFQIPLIDRWKDRSKFLDKRKIEYRRINKNYEGQSLEFKGFRVWLTNKSIVVYFPKGKSYYSNSASSGKNYALFDTIELIKSLERFFGVSFKINKEYKFKVGRQHYAKVSDDLAKHYRRNNQKLVIKNNKGVWCIADYSFNVDELETVNKDSADSDLDNVVVPFLNDLKDHYDNTREILKVSDILGVVNIVAMNQLNYAENIKSHIGAIQDLGLGVVKMIDLLKKLEVKLK